VLMEGHSNDGYQDANSCCVLSVFPEQHCWLVQFNGIGVDTLSWAASAALASAAACAAVAASCARLSAAWRAACSSETCMAPPTGEPESISTLRKYQRLRLIHSMVNECSASWFTVREIKHHRDK
jgi:hypothetical protein